MKLDSAPMQADYKTILRFQLLLGRGVSEVAGIEIDMDARLWTITALRVKNRKELKVPLTRMARGIIGDLLNRKGQLLLPNVLGNAHDGRQPRQHPQAGVREPGGE